MSANVESMFSVRQMPWHREGTVLQDYPGSWAQARALAGLDWDPVTTEVYAITGLTPDGTVLSLNRSTYTVINHGEMGEIVEAVLAQRNAR